LQFCAKLWTVPCDSLDGNFSAAVVKVLNTMPYDEQQLLAAFQANSLCGRRFEAFAGYSNRHKFQAFKEYLLSLARGDQQSPE
jgi:hypothetical protein